MTGFYTLLKKEILRFWKVSFQTVAAPVLTALLYQLIFAHSIGQHVQPYPGVSYAAFLIPGLAMMSMLQNSFANASSSLIQSKITGNIVFILLPPLSHLEFFAAYLLAAMTRGLIVGIGVIAITLFFAVPPFTHPLWLLVFMLLGCGVMGALGIIAGIWAEKYDQLAGFQNFIIMPLTFLSGVFYSIHSLPSFWQGVSRFNPVFYMIDGFRYGCFGVGDVSPWQSLAVVGVTFLLLATGTLHMLRAGYKLKH
jgi:ABC-2 type transport system permease protein